MVRHKAEIHINRGFDYGWACWFQLYPLDGAWSGIVENISVHDGDTFGILVLNLNQETFGSSDHFGTLNLGDLDLWLKVCHRVANTLTDNFDDIGRLVDSKGQGCSTAKDTPAFHSL